MQQAKKHITEKNKQNPKQQAESKPKTPKTPPETADKDADYDNKGRPNNPFA